MATNVSPPNRASVTVVTATLEDAGTFSRVHVIPSRGGLLRVAVGRMATPTSRTLGEITRGEAQALLDALATALDVTDENGVQA